MTYSILARFSHLCPQFAGRRAWPAALLSTVVGASLLGGLQAADTSLIRRSNLRPAGFAEEGEGEGGGGGGVLAAAIGANAALIGWSDLGVHETDGSDVSVYSILPPYSTIHAQFISSGKLLTSANGIIVTYEAVADPAGSINATSQGKGNFYQHAQAQYGAMLAPDQGLAGFAMPGAQNHPQTMAFDSARKWFTAEGIPITPYDDQGRKNYYPMMRLVARDGAGNQLASTDIVLPVNDEMDCRACHASGSHLTAKPPAGWAWDCDPDTDTKLNVLRYHDQIRTGSSAYTDALRKAGYNPKGLAATVAEDHRPVLCVRCHSSNALPGSGTTGMRPLSSLMHTKHAKVLDPDLGVPLDDLKENAACFRCHASSAAHYQRGVHGHTPNTDGTLAMQCQSCHGTMTAVGEPARQAWLDQPNCQSCHTGTATKNNGQLRYTSSFEVSGQVRKAVDATFATEPNMPTNGLSLYRFSRGHGGLQCAACHGAAHAEWPSAQPNDNVQSQQLQGHTGALLDCGACHTTTPATIDGGPHGMHPVGQEWIRGHSREGQSTVQCQACHGRDLRGTALSQMLADRTVDSRGTKQFWRGFQIGCYNCHAGPNNDDATSNRPAVVSNNTATTLAEKPVTIPLQAVDPDGNALTLRVVSQPTHGAVTLSGKVATYFPAPGFLGNDAFTFSAWDGSTDSNLGNVNVTVNPGNGVLTASAFAPAAALPGAPVPFRANATLAQSAGTLGYEWNFGDGSPVSSASHICHAYSSAGDYAWKLTVTANGLRQTVNGVVTISPQLGPTLRLAITQSYGMLLLSWPLDGIGTVLETTSDPSVPGSWTPRLDAPIRDGSTMTLESYILPGPEFFRLRRAP